MNPISILPHDFAASGQYLDDLFGQDECGFCGASLTTEAELQNSICLACVMEEERAAKFDAFNDLTSACRGILRFRDIIEDDIRSEYRESWERATQSLCQSLRAARSL